MAGYTRQSIADILNGLDITAPPLTKEFNQLEAAFESSTGHSHDGTAGNAPKIDLTTSVSGYLPEAHGGVGGLNKTDATTNPSITNDGTQGYAPGSLWLNVSSDRVFVCVDNSTGAAIWHVVAAITENNVFFPETNDTVDLGKAAQRFKNLYLSGAADITGNTTIGGTLNVTGTTTLGAVNTSGVTTIATADINGGNVDNTIIGNTTPKAITGTVVTANTGFTGDLTGNVTGNVSGDLTGNVTGNVTGDVTGDITSAGTSTFQDVTIDGTLNMNAATTATITGLATPVNTTDAATKGYVDQEVTAVIDAAPGALDTLNELAAALNDDANFATTVNTSIATKLSKAGDTMSGQLDLGTNKVVNVATPTAGSDATTKSYVDGVDATKLNLSGGTMTGNIVLGANKVTTTANPTTDDDLARKAYVDSILGSATDAETSAANAATSETNAASSETNAATSAANAAASYDSFDDRYLGSKSSAPSTDNDGDPLIEGALYWDTTAKSLYIYNGTAWSAAALDTNGLGSISTQDANNVSITGGSITDITDLAIADGGTGASTASAARTNLGVNDPTITISAGTGLTGGGSFTLNQAGTETITLNASGGVSSLGNLSDVVNIYGSYYLGSNSGGGSGSANVAVGDGALRTGDNDYCVAIGNSALGDFSMDNAHNNVAVGYQAGNNVTTGDGNTLVGASAAGSLDIGANNVAVGFDTLSSYTSSSNTVAIGYQAGDNLTAGSCSLIGYRAGARVTSGFGTIAIGSGSMGAATGNSVTGNDNIAIGRDSLVSVSSGRSNIGIGKDVLASLTNAFQNVVVGESAGNSITSGGQNICLGHLAGFGITSGTYNIALGYSAMSSAATGSQGQNIAIGTDCLDSLTSGIENIAMGHDAADALTTGNYNVAIGGTALGASDNGYNNTVIGYSAGSSVTTGFDNVFVGYLAGYTTTTGDNVVCIGDTATASSATATDEFTLGNSSIATLRCQQTSITALSDARFKENIEDVRPELGLDLIEKVRVVEFDWNERDEGLAGKHQVGVIAQEMAQIEDELDADFLKLTLRENPERLEAAPGQLLLPLIKAVQELSTKNKSLEERLAALEAKQ